MRKSHLESVWRSCPPSWCKALFY